MTCNKLVLFYLTILTTVISGSITHRYSGSGSSSGKDNNINSIKEGISLVTNDENTSDDDDEPVRIRTEDVCSFTKLEKRVEPKPDPEECKKINELFKVNDDYNFINYFGQAFDLLNKGAESLIFPTKFKMDTIFFTGNTGSGKSTLVQVLGTDNRNIFSKPVNGEKTEFIIIDSNSKIGAETINSETLYPDLLVDRETNYVLSDNPGFRDTRSPVHEIVAMYSMKKVLQHTNKMKVVMVTTHSSVKTGMYRDDFTNLLKHTIDLVNDIDKYQSSFYLIANKVENTYSLEKGKMKVVSDKEIVNEIGQFLIDVKSSLRGRKNVFNSSSNNLYYVQNAVKVINGLLEKNSDGYNHINILRRPAEEGPLSEIDLIQNERNNIRNTLLNSNNMVQVNEEDFGFALSDSAIMYLSDLFHKMNSYITELSDLISLYITGYYKALINSQTDINEVIVILNKLKSNIKSLSRNIQYAENPTQYINIMSNFSEKNNLKLDCLTIFKNISTLNEYLSNLNDFSSSSKYSSLSWSNSIGKISTHINDGLQKYQFVQNLYQYLNSYDIQNMRKSYNKVLEKVNQLFGVNLNSDENNYVTDSDLSVKIDEILKTNLKHRIDFLCKDNTLIITDFIVLLSELKDDYFSACDANMIVILAMHTVYIDQDLAHDWLRGKDLTIISPKWDVRGSRKISVDGISGGAPLPKADVGLIGMYGNNGKKGGKFYGIGMNFYNGDNLVISANGGDGQDGQEGGDGEDGSAGDMADRSQKQQVDEKGLSYSGFGYTEKKYVARGSKGGDGGDAGAGGKGGFGGRKGSIIIHNIGNEEHGIISVAEQGREGKSGKDGNPGKGGVKGCDEVIKERKLSVMGFEINMGSSRSQENCFTRNKDGRVRKAEQPQKQDNEQTNNNDSPVCIHIMRFQDIYLKKFHHSLTDGLTKKFITEMKLTKY